jgi:hypothetical protein
VTPLMYVFKSKVNQYLKGGSRTVSFDVCPTGKTYYRDVNFVIFCGISVPRMSSIGCLRQKRIFHSYVFVFLQHKDHSLKS